VKETVVSHITTIPFGFVLRKEKIMQQQKRCATLMVLIAFAFMHSNAFSAPDLTDGLMGKWSFDEGQGDAARDEIGGHDGVVERATWTTDAKGGGYALEFSPADDTKVTVAHSNDFFGADGSFTVSNWAKPLSRGAMMDKSGRADRMQWFLMEDGRLHWGAGPNFTFTDGPVVKFGEWSHVAWSHNPVDESVAYVNGEEVHNQKGLGKVLPTGEPMYFGDMGVLPGNNPKQQNFEGIIDEIGFWNRPLSAKEVKEVFDRGLNQILAVSAHGKLAMTWAAVKARN
jgi:hypothetical protein